ncbi:MAG: hypothetical protein R3304_02245 [Longimicrobiales bacterium]|nr:hypothetical protein [Longimicrobiales bacterium]
MINPRMKSSSAAPAWVVLGAPLLGVPLLVGLLALAAPGNGPAEVDDEPVVTIETVEDVAGIRPVSCPGPTPESDVRTG